MSEKMQNQRIDNESRKNQYLAIKARLNKVYDESGLTINGLKEALNNCCDFEINYETLRKTLSFDCNTLDIYCVIAMCKYFNLNTAYILSEANNPDNAILYEESQYISDRFAELDDKKYLSNFYGYFYSPKRNNDSIDKFHLEMKKEGKKTFAFLNISYSSMNPGGGEKNTGTKKLIGRPVFVKPQNIYIVFTEASGAFYIFSFSYVQYNLRDLYFRRGAILTQGRDATRQPMFQSFVMFDNPVKPENMDIINGLLLLNDNAFHISARELDALIKADEQTAQLVFNLQYIFDANREQYYLVDELQILNSLKGCMSKTDAVRVLQLMKARATDARRIYFPESDDYSEFSKLLTK